MTLQEIQQEARDKVAKVDVNLLIDALIASAYSAGKDAAVDVIEKICPDYYDTKPTAEDLAVNHVLREILALLTTSPS